MKITHIDGISSRRGEEAQKYKEMSTTKHDAFLESFLTVGSYKKLYSYTHLLNGFAVHANSEKVLFLAYKVHSIVLGILSVKQTN